MGTPSNSPSVSFLLLLPLLLSHLTLPFAVGVSISEILVLPAGAGASGGTHSPAWIELSNPATSAVDLSQYSIAALNDNGVVSTSSLPLGTTIGPGGFLLLWADGGRDGNLAEPGGVHITLVLFDVYGKGLLLGLFSSGVQVGGFDFRNKTQV